jgi:hypothetical protein
MVKLTNVFTPSAALVLKGLCHLGDKHLNVVLEGLRNLYS